MIPLSPYLSKILSMKYCSAGGVLLLLNSRDCRPVSKSAAIAVAAKKTMAHVDNIVRDWSPQPRAWRLRRRRSRASAPHYQLSEYQTTCAPWYHAVGTKRVSSPHLFVYLSTLIGTKFARRFDVGVLVAWSQVCVWDFHLALAGVSEAGSNTVTDKVVYLRSGSRLLMRITRMKVPKVPLLSVASVQTLQTTN